LTRHSFLFSKVLEVRYTLKYISYNNDVDRRVGVIIFEDPFDCALPDEHDSFDNIHLFNRQSQIRDLDGHPFYVLFTQRALVIETRFI
jgi:hypothetical protein